MSHVCPGTEAESAEAETAFPATPMLIDTWPNPFNGTTSVRYSLPQQGTVRLSVIDLLGREVAVLDQGQRQAGEYVSIWNATSQPSGIYFMLLESSQDRTVRRITPAK